MSKQKGKPLIAITIALGVASVTYLLQETSNEPVAVSNLTTENIQHSTTQHPNTSSTAFKIENLNEGSRSQEPDRTLASEHNTLEDDPWKYPDNDSAFIMRTAAKFKLPPENLLEVHPNFQLMDTLYEGASLALPIKDLPYDIYIKSVTTNNGITSIQGHINGASEGYGVTLTYAHGVIMGSFITPTDNYEIRTIEGRPVLIRDMRTVADGVDDTPPPYTPSPDSEINIQGNAEV